MPSLADINNYFATVKNQFDKNLIHRIWHTNPFVSMFPRVAYDPAEGLIPEVLTSTHELPTAYPFGLPNLALSTGTGATACDPAVTVIKSGHKKRSYQLEVASFETEVICLTDLIFGYQAAQQVKNKERGLMEFATVFNADWFRVKNIGMHNQKASTTAATSLSTKSDALYDFSTLTLPTHYLNWIHLNGLYDQFVRLGAGMPEHRLGTDTNGGPVFGLCVGPGYKRALYQNDDLVRETVNYSPDVMQNLVARGTTKAVNGFVPTVDEFPIRYKIDDDELVAIYPFINQNTTVGRESVPNPDYRTVANGGDAVYEVATILIRGTYEVRPRPTGGTDFGKAGFKAQNFFGDIRWVNNPNMTDNKRGDKGFYLFDLQQAAKPLVPELGMSILTLAVD
jgi:hypothetical protein